MTAKAKDKKTKQAPEQADVTDQKVEVEAPADEVQLSDAEKTILQLNEENERLRDQMLRARAEFENYKRRRNSDLASLNAAANEGLISDLLEVLDDFDLLIEHANKTEGEKPLLEGALKIQEKLNGLLAKRGLEPLNAEGESFDPELHEALMQQPSADHEPGTVMAVHQKGYRLGEKLLRAARVIVSGEAQGEK